jgi:tetratricopeptide (TPR) repeat protein
MVVLILLAYANSFPGAFFFDDEAAILQNTSIRDLTSLRHVLWPPVQAGIGGRPFANLTFALNYAVSDYQAWSYHLINLVLHAATALLLFGLTRRTLLLPSMRDRFGAAATAIAGVTALLWGLHPLEANIVDYMSQRTEGMMGTFYLLTLYAFVRSTEDDQNPSGWTALAVVAAALGMATKEGMVTVPAMVLLYDRTFISGTFSAALRNHAGRHAGVAATWLLLGGLMAFSKLSERGVGFDLGHTWYDYALTECRSIVRYLQLAYWPHPLVFDYGPNYVHGWKEALPGAGVLVLALGATLYALWRAPAVGFVAAWFFVVLSPSSSVVPVVQQPCAENRVYLPLAGAIALVAVVAYRAIGRRSLPWLLGASLALGVATSVRNPVFASELAVWWDTAAKRPQNARAQNNLGNALLKADRNDEAAPYFAKAIELSPRYADARNNLGVTLLRKGRPQDAITEFEQAIADKDGYSDAYYNLGEAYLQLGRDAEAITALEHALKLDPNNPKAHNNLGIALLDTGRVQESIEHERTALKIQPDMPEAHYNLGNSLAKAGQTAEALAEYDAALQIDPKFARAHNNAGVLLLHLGRTADAAARFEAALQIDPNYPEARRNLEIVKPRK